jgi:hypothetical protein
VLALIVSTRTAGAEPTAADRGAAESLFQDGRRLLELGEVATACTKFAESQRLAPALGSLLNLAACHEREGKTASAWIEFSEAATLSERAGEGERAAYAAERAQALGAELGTVTITVTAGTSGRVVTLDGREVRPGTYGTAIPVDPGEHTVRATAPGRVPFARSFTVARGRSATTVEVPELAADAPRSHAAPPALAAVSKRASPRALPPPSSGRAGSLAPLLVAGGVAAAGIAIGSVYGLKTFREKETVDELCPGSDRACPSADGVSANERAHDAALVSTISFGVGAAASAVLAYLLLSGVGDDEPGSISVAARLDPDEGHVFGRAKF